MSKPVVQILTGHPLRTGGTTNTWKESRSLIHTCLRQWKTLEQLTMAVGRMPPCLHSQQEGMYSQCSHFSAKPDGLFYTSEGLEQGCQTRAEQPEAHRHILSLQLSSQEGWTPGRSNFSCYSSSVNTLVGRHAQLLWNEDRLRVYDCNFSRMLVLIIQLDRNVSKSKNKLYRKTFYLETDSRMAGGEAELWVAY